MVDVAYIILFALAGMVIFKKLGLPGILGMIAAGVVLGPSALDLIDPEVQEVLAEFKTIALIVILFRAGLGIDRNTLKTVGGPAIRMGLIPATIEGFVVASLAGWLFGLPLYASLMLGSIVAAVSPAIVVPHMLRLRDQGYGTRKGIPTMILAGASLDDILTITLFGLFTSLATGASTNWTYYFLGVPGGVVAGILIGVIIGYMAVWFFKKYHMRDTIKVILLMIFAVIFYDATEIPEVKNTIPVAALIGIMAIGFIILERYDVLANRMAVKFNKVWVLAEILLFVYIGTEVKISKIDPNIVLTGLLIIMMGLIARSIGVWISLLGSNLNNKEKLFTVFAYWPKATVQAAIGAVPLTMILGGTMSGYSEEIGQIILTMAVLAIVITAPLGAIIIRLTGHKLLKKDQVGTPEP